LDLYTLSLHYALPFSLETVFLLSRSTSRASYSTAIPFPARSAKTKVSSFSGSQIQHRFVRFDLGRRHHVPNPFFVINEMPAQKMGRIDSACLFGKFRRAERRVTPSFPKNPQADRL